GVELERISRGSAEQRAGRAGRLERGIALRLWTAAEERSLPERTEAEVRRVDLCGPVLQLLAFGERDVDAFPWFEQPPQAAVARALELLGRLGATDARGLTDVGRRLPRLPVHPRLGRLLLEAHARGVLELGALAAALLQERDPFARRGDAPRTASPVGSDVLERALALRAFARSERSAPALNAGAARFALRVADGLRAEVE